MYSRINFSSTVLFGILISTPSFSKDKTGEITIQGIVPVTYEFNISSVNSIATIHLQPSADYEGIESKIETIHMSYSNKGLSVGQLFIESENNGRLVSSSNPSEIMKHQKYLVKLHDNNQDLQDELVSKYMDTTYDLAVPASVDIESDLNAGMNLDKEYNVHVVIPTVNYAQNTVYTDKITFTFMDSN